MSKLFNLARMSSATVGTGTITLGSAVSGYLTFALAGVSDADVISYGIKDGSSSEIGTGTYTASGTTLTRTVTKSTNSNTAISLSGSAEVFITARAEDLFILSRPSGRLTLATATPVMTSTQSAKTTIFYTPYLGSQIPLFDGTSFTPTSFAEISVATTDTAKNPAAIGASKVNDWFVWNDAGTLRLTHSVDWTNDSTRASALTLQNGIYLNTSAITNGPAALRGTWVGTTRSNGSSQLDFIYPVTGNGPTAGFFGVWNSYNRVAIPFQFGDSITTYTYNSTTIREAHGDTTYSVGILMGLQEDIADLHYSVVAQAAASGDFLIVGFGDGSTTSFNFGFGGASPGNIANNLGPATAMYKGTFLGFKTITPNEKCSAAQTVTAFPNTSTVAPQGGISGIIRL